MSQKQKKGPRIRVSIPPTLYTAILKIQVNDGLNFDEAADKAASVLEPNGQMFREAVQKEAQILGQGRFMQQLNKARASIRSAAINEGAEYVRTHEVHFEIPCPKCGKPMKFSSSDQNWEKSRAALHDAFKDWSHVTCQK